MVHRIKRQRASRTEHKLVVEVVHKEKGWQRLGYIFWSWKNEPGMFAKEKVGHTNFLGRRAILEKENEEDGTGGRKEARD